MPDNDTAAVRAAEQYSALWFGDSRLIVRLDAETTSGTVALIECWSPRGSSSPLHRADYPQSYVIRDGELAMFLDGSWHRLSSGASVYLPLGVPFASIVLSHTARYDVLAVPAGLERFFRHTSVPAAGPGLPPSGRAEPTAQMLADAAASAGVEVLGPVPAFTM